MKIRKLISLLLASVLLISLCACHGNGVRKQEDTVQEAADTQESDPAQEDTALQESSAQQSAASKDIGTFDPDKEYNITFWAKNDTNIVQTAIYEKAISDFEALYPNITVSLRLYTDYSTIYNDVITNIATNTTPNVCVTYPDHIATYLTGDDIVANLDDYICDERYGLGGSEVRFSAPTYEEMIPQFLEECKIGGSLYAVPFMRSTEACYVNKTMLEQLGYTLPEVLTWDFIWEVSEKAMEKNADGTFKLNGQKVLIPFIYKSTDNMMISMLRQRGADYSTSDGKIMLFNSTTRDILLSIAPHAGTRSFSTFKISSYPGNFLNAGQCIFAIDSTAGATWMGSEAPLLDIAEDKLVSFETEVMMIPQYDPENPQMISQGPSICVFNKDDSGEVIASWLFTQYLLTNEVQIAYSQTEGYVPVTSKAQQSEEYLDYLSREGEDNDTYYYVKIRAAKLLLENTENTFVTPVFNGSASLRDAAGQLVENVTKSMRRSETVDDAYLDTMFESVISMYHLNQGGLEIVQEGSSQATEENTSAQDGALTVSDGTAATQTSSSGFNKDLGPLPSTAKALLISLAAVWVLIGAYTLYGYVMKKKAAGKR